MESFISSIAAAFPVQDSFDQLGRLTALDRFQASDGIVKAADYIAELLNAFGLSEVRVHHYACPSNWWTFEGPLSWTPTQAELRLAGDRRNFVLRYPGQPMCLATYSAPTDARGIRAPLRIFHDLGPDEAVAGTILLIDSAITPYEEGIAAAERGGAAGIIIDPLAGRLPGARGRIELSARTKLFGFSVTSDEFSCLYRAAQNGESVDATVSVGQSSPMPLVEGCIGGADVESEILIQAHLCHPRPGANDNCSGVVAALGLASCFASLRDTTPFRRRRRGIRFLFGPEFVGTVAYIHDFLRPGKRPRPIAAINLDMVGENQALCGGPLTLELPPDHLPSPLGALAEWCLSSLPGESKSYSGAVPVRDWNAVAIPFVGASDHGVYADRSIGIPSMLIGHWPDRFNHTSFDTPDKVDPMELRRAATIAGACASILTVAGAENHDELSRIVVQHTLGRLLAASRLELRAGDGVFSPSAAECRADLVGFLAECGKSNLAALEQMTGKTSERGHEAIERQKLLLYALLDVQPRSGSSDPRSSVVIRSWPGPFNVRGLLERATGPHAKRIERRLSEDKGNYATVLALALAIDDRSSRSDVIRRAAFSSMLDIDPAFANDVFDAIIEAGWGQERPG